MRKPNGYGSIKKLSGNRRRPYMFTIYKDGKQQPIAYFETQVDAEIYASDYNRNKSKILYKHEVTFKELYFRWLPFHTEKYQPAKTTLENYSVSFNHCLSLHELPINKIKYHHLQQVIDDVKRKGLSYSTCKKIRSLISLMFKYAVIMEYVDKNYASLLNLGKNKPVRPHEPFTRQKINKLWSNINTVNGVDTALILIYTGMRIGELLELTKDNIYLRQKYIRITKSKTQAGLRVIPIHEKILPLIVNRINSVGKHLICNEKGSPYSYTSYCIIWKRIMSIIKGKHTTHDCRHTCATLMDNAEVNENAKKRILGHTGGDITNDVYTHKNLKQLRKAINKIK